MQLLVRNVEAYKNEHQNSVSAFVCNLGAQFGCNVSFTKIC